jgi:LmbE family N-acetylglucosaminyl deacetylase
MSHTVILSPHLDDAVFNCWHILNQHPVTVMTVFAGLPAPGTVRLWDGLCGERDSHRMVQHRREENERALKKSSASIKYLDFLDVQYRGTAPILDMLVREIIAQAPHNSIFLVPLAATQLWRHPDHVLLRKAGLMLKDLGRQVAFYPDIPYMHLPKYATDAHLHKLASRASRCIGLAVTTKMYWLTTDEKSAKRQAMKTYQSQYRMTNLVSFGGLSRAVKRNYELVLEVAS